MTRLAASAVIRPHLPWSDCAPRWSTRSGPEWHGLWEGEVVAVNKRDRGPDRDGLITLRSPQNGERMLKRVVGLGGDAVDNRGANPHANGGSGR